jgi:hypothetical protein
MSTDGARILFEIFRWHAFFPFPLRDTEPGTPCINENAFLRAICLLARNPPTYLFPHFSSVVHSKSSGNWGPYSD